MDDQFFHPSVMEAFNASRLSAPEVASTFVPPHSAFSQLVTKNHCILIGPRGSGKTTLLKMLTPAALSSWRPKSSPTLLPTVNFIGVFVGADRAWQKQLAGEKANEEVAAAGFGKVAFTTHIFSQLIGTIRSLKLLDPDSSMPLVARPKPLTEAGELAFVDSISEVWEVKPRIRSLEGVSLALSARLAEIGRLRKEAFVQSDPQKFFETKAPYKFLSYSECASYAIDAFKVFSQSEDMSWAFLFDEFEIAPSELQREVIENCRAKESSILYKIAIAPYNKNFALTINDLDPSPGNDFVPIELWYPKKNEAHQFSEDLVKRMITEQGLKGEGLHRIFQSSPFGFQELDDPAPYSNDGSVRSAFDALARKDPSFKSYLRDQGIDLSNWARLTENKRAEIRKVRSVVITRNYFRGVDRGRSRKISDLYAGYPTLLEVAEGNPRLLITIMAPLMRELSIQRARNAQARVPLNKQAASIQSVANAFRSLLKTIPYTSKGGQGSKGILGLIDQIGTYFFEKSIVADFVPQPALSFIVDANADEATLDAIARALNIGAIVHVPDPGADPMLKAIPGKRFRLSYLLAAYYKIPVMLNTPISLSKVLQKKSASNQEELF